jgi:hypothetical protein
MIKVAEEFEQSWHSRLLQDNAGQSYQERQSIICWLLGEDQNRFEELNSTQLTIAQQAMDYRYRILRQRYLKVNPTQAYRNLITRLGSLVMLRNKIRTWVALSRDRQRAVADVIQEIIQEMLNSDRYIQQQIAWISQCTSDTRLRNALLLTSVEEYCLRPIRNKPLLVYRFVNFLRRSQRGGMTQVPQKEIVRLISDEVMAEDLDSPVSLLDSQAVTEYEDNQNLEEQQALRSRVQQEFENYLQENVGDLAVRWLKLYLQGCSQDMIAKTLDLPIKQIYRLREKISYHALRVFAIKEKSDLVATWLETSLQEHNLGLTPTQWESYWQSLTPIQQQILQELKAGKTLEIIAKELNWKINQVMGEWSKLYFAAQALRSA